jgi:hypothetical protein
MLREAGYAAQQLGGWWSLLQDEPTPELQWPRSVAVYDRMRRQDAQVASVLRAVTLPVRRTPWRVDPAGASERVAGFVADNLGLPVVGAADVPAPRTRDRFSWGEHLRLALLMLPHGHSFFEQVYRVDGSGMARLRKLGHRPAHTIAAVNVARDGGLESVEQWGSGSLSSGRNVVLPVDRLVAYVNEREGGNWLGQSLLRSAYKHWLIKDRLLRVQAQTIERNGMGVPRYTGAELPDDPETDLEKGLELATSWRSGDAAGAAIPFGARLDLVGVDGDLPDAEPAIRYHDEQIARAVLAHFLNLGTQTGSWALGSTFADFFVESLQAVAQQVADVATQHVVEDLVDVNFGEAEPAPRVVFDEIGSRQAATAQAITMLLDAGALRADRSLEEALRQQYGLPPKDTPPPQEAI